MTYQEALRYLDSFVNFEKTEGYNYKASLKLERMRRLACLLGDPQKATRSIHIAGSKGKGSTASYVYSILKSAGFRTGLYTSPHLVTFRERIRINDSLISEEDIAAIMGRIRRVVDSSMKDDRPTFFEIYTALAYIYFKEKKADFAVYEVGLGGRLDATNLIEPLVCAITPLSYEHTDKLGNTLKDIAAEKCGIIKPGAICVSAPQTKEALDTIEAICKKRMARLILVGRDIKFKELESNEYSNVFDVEGAIGKYPALKTTLIGTHQITNAATAVGIIEALNSKGVEISSDSIRNGIGAAKWEGRLEVICKAPLIVVDGAHNKASAIVLADSVKKIFADKRPILIFGASKDKDVKGMLEELLPIVDSVIFTKSKVAGRALDPLSIDRTASEIMPKIRRSMVTQNVKEAIDRAVSYAKEENMILVTGSLFIVGEAKEHCPECLNTARMIP